MQTNEEIITALRVIIRWTDFRNFCDKRTACKGCPYYRDHICSMATDQTVMKRVAKAAERFLTQEGIMI